MPERHLTSATVLSQLGLFLPGSLTPDKLGDNQTLSSVLSILSTAWRRFRDHTKSARQKIEAERQLDLLAHCERQAVESWSEEDPRIPPLVKDWLKPRRWWWSETVPAARRVAIVSSRLPKRLDPQGFWLQALRAALIHVREQNSTLVIGHGTAGHDLNLRGATRHEIQTLLLRCCNDTPSEKWMDHWSSHRMESLPDCIAQGWGLPALTPAVERDDAKGNQLETLPERDRAPIAWADEVIVLGLRPRGNLEALIRCRLKSHPGSVWLADLPDLQPAKLRTELLDLGAVLWAVKPQSIRSNEASTSSDDQQHRAHGQACNSVHGRADTIPLPATEGWKFLTHATRACDGSWPGQTRNEYLDSLLDGDSDAEHSPLAALLRIITQRRLHASNQAIRGGFPVVSFTAVPLIDLPRLRVFRSHRGRWDFEPYGICIRQEWLERRGARPVLYNQEAAWKELSEGDRPYFQLARSTRRTRHEADERSSMDWTVEREWRHLGNLDLSELAHADAFVFVPTQADANELLRVSPWPVVILAKADNSEVEG